ncbi:uncharacterized protein LOC126792294 [Argentina anserina]|uniref:uncharacterized protein LOC126792294 n=1 Tax=Argentina anserina TaxID=57926 RepID=UPI0021764997|nr:uncharacterized protein LOC126792294 [Potentilla anserina]
MDLGGGFKVKHGHFRAGLDSGEILVVRLPDKKVMRIVSRSVFLALVMLTLPCIRSIIKGVSVSELESTRGSDMFKFEQLGMIFNDLAGEGLRVEGDKSLIVSPSNAGVIHALRSLNVVGDGFEVAMDSDSERKSSFKDESVDFVFAFDLVDAKFVDRVLKVGGIVAVPLSNDPSNAFSKTSNYKIVYLRRYASTFVAMRKTGPAAEQQQENAGRRRLCQFGSEAKEAVLQGLEDVLLEPPRRGLAKSSQYLKKMKFLPDLLGNSLENYERRVFVNVDLNEKSNGAIEWFHQNYPKMNTEFEVHNLELEAEEEASSKPQKDVSGWLKENVKEEDYVVMKAEAEVVVDMMQKRSICLVDELFLECNNEWWQNGKTDKSKRAYWECIALHGRLRDLGVAVHQWFL